MSDRYLTHIFHDSLLKIPYEKRIYTMPRPKGSKNKSTTGKKQPVRAVTPVAPVKARPKLPVDEVMTAVSDFQTALTKGGEQIGDILTTLTEDFETLKSLVTPEEKPVVASTKSSKKPAPVVDEEDDEEEEEDEDAEEEEDDEEEEDADEEDEDLNFDVMTLWQLQDFIEKNDLDVDLKAHKGLTKKRAAVAEAYEDVEDDEEDDEADVGDDEDDEDDDWDSPKPVAAKKKPGRK